MINLLKLSPYTGDIAAPSPNHDSRIALGIEGIVLHATADAGDERYSLAWMRSRKSRVSCHLYVARTGRVTRLVGDRERAWHAGLSWWRGTSDVNSITLGVEIANRNDGEPYTAEQYRRVAEIVSHYCGQGLSLDDVVSHAKIAQGRKTDPHGWDWDHLRALVTDGIEIAADQSLVIPEVRSPVPGNINALPTVKPAVRPPLGTPAKQPAAVSNAPKHVVRSRTLWLNLLTVLGASCMLVANAVDLAQRFGLHLAQDVAKWALFAVGVANVLLRMRTNQPLTCSLKNCLPAGAPASKPDSTVATVRRTPQPPATDRVVSRRPMPADQSRQMVANLARIGGSFPRAK